MRAARKLARDERAGGAADQGIPHHDCEAACVDEALAELPDDPCWAEAIELRRCLVRGSACEDVPEETAPAGPGTTCEPTAADLDACDRS